MKIKCFFFKKYINICDLKQLSDFDYKRTVTMTTSIIPKKLNFFIVVIAKHLVRDLDILVQLDSHYKYLTG